MKKSAVILAVMMMGTMVMACGQKEKPMEADTTAEETEIPDTVAEETEAPDTTAEETTTEAVDTAAEEDSKAGGYEDNFAVDNEAVAAFADKIKAAVAAQDLH